MILFKCKCGEELEAADDEAGHRLMCPICSRHVVVPRPGQDLVRENVAAPQSHAIQAPTAPSGFQDPADTSAAPGTQSSKSWASLVLGVLSFCLPLLLGIPAIIVGVMGLVEVRRSNGRMGGVGHAILGIGCGVVSSFLVLLLVPVVGKVRDDARATISLNNLKQIALAIDNHHEVYKAFPKQAISSADGRPLLSWRVAILGYIEEYNLYKQFKLDEPWDSLHNRSLLRYMPATYRLPTSSDQGEDFTTFYQGFVGKNAFFRASHLEKVTRADITDGAANTLMVVEAATAVPWTKPEDIPYEPDRPVPRLGGHLRWGFNAVLANGAPVRIDSNALSEQTLRNAITINDGRPLGPDWPFR